MEQFVELMLATDRKARDMIEKARGQKAQAISDAHAQAEVIRQADEKRLADGKAQVDAALTQEKQAQAKALEQEFLAAKHTLDERFNTNRDAWLKQVCSEMLQA